MGIVKKNGINYTAPGAGGGGGTPVEYIEQTSMQELSDEGTWEPDTLYLVMYDDSITIFETFYNGEFYLLTQGRGTYVTDMDITDWNLLIEDPDEPVWNNCSTGYYFIWSDNGDNKVLVKIANVYDDEESKYGRYIYPTDEDKTIHLMTQSQYDAIIDGGGWPEGFVFCTDSNNFYWHDHTIVENTPPTP